jgi:hypothetical protein
MVERVQRRIFGSVREEVRGKWRKLCNAELHNMGFVVIPVLNFRNVCPVTG